MNSSDDMTALAAEFPGWHIWRSRSARGADAGWHATRKRGGIVTRLAAADATALRSLLGQYEALTAVPA